MFADARVPTYTKRVGWSRPAWEDTVREAYLAGGGMARLRRMYIDGDCDVDEFEYCVDLLLQQERG